MFNTSTRRDDMSMKLRSQNLRNAKEETRALDMESRHMEVRLEELKVAMTREKEEREDGQNSNGTGSGYWQKGQTGNLTNYGQDVLKKPKKGSGVSSNRDKSSKKMRVKVLKDEPITVPDRSKKRSLINNLEPSTKEKVKGPKCGQCEQKGANVSCQECGEDYCAGCFAAFHLRGALKKHRSVPIGSMGFRPNMTPRTTDSNRINNAVRTEKPAYDNDNHNNQNYTGQESVSPVMSTTSDNLLLAGDYDEQANAAEFASALAAWRTGKAQPDGPVTGKVDPKPLTTNTRHAPKQQAESSTSTQEIVKPPIKIKFKSSLTYAERLLLKKYRRHDLGMLPAADRWTQHSAPHSPPSDAYEFEGHVTLDDVMEMVTPRSGVSRNVDPFQESAHVLPGQHDTVYHTTQGHLEGQYGTNNWHDDLERSESRMSIIMVNDSVPEHELKKFEQSSSYKVTEGVDDTIHYKNHMPDESSDVKHRYAFATPPTSGRPSPSGLRPSSVRRSYTRSPINKSPNFNKENLDEYVSTSQMSLQNTKRNEVKSARQTSVNSARGSKSASTKKERPKSRTKSQAINRADSRASSARPGSRAKSRTYMYGEGHLTKGPSESLKDIARMAGEVESYEYKKSNLGSFFTFGVEPEVVKDRVLTPRAQRKKEPLPAAGITKWRVSNELYAMSPRSWRPDSSLGENANNDQVTSYLQDPEVAALMQMSSDVMDEPTSKNYVMEDEEGSTLSWSLSSHMMDEAKREKHTIQNSAQVKRPFIPSNQTSRERSMYREEKRDRAFQQGEDLVPAHLPTSVSALAPEGLESSICSVRPNSRGVLRPDSGRIRSQTPKLNYGSPSFDTSTAPLGADNNVRMLQSSRPASASGRESRAIIIDGDDLRRFDELAVYDNDVEDAAAIDQLEWELASHEGRITADGKISRMIMMDPEAEVDIPEDTSPGRGLDSPTFPHQDIIDRQITESVLMDDFSEMEEHFNAEEVAALY